MLTDIVSLVRYAIHEDDELVPYSEMVHVRFNAWLQQQQGLGREFTSEQIQWLHQIENHIAGSLRIEREDFDYSPFIERGGLGRVYQVFGDQLFPLIDELNRVLVA